MNSSSAQWAIVLAGGEGRRLASYIRQKTGEATPKQFCPLIGRTTLLEDTVARLSPPICRERTIVVLTREHERFYSPIVGRMEIPANRLLVQPANRETGPAVLYALMHVTAADPNGIVAIFPADHYLSDVRRFMDHVAIAFESVRARPDIVVVLGVAAETPETGYGWIEPGERVGGIRFPLRYVERFWEKPARAIAEWLLQRNCLWSTLVVVAQAQTLLNSVQAALPDLHQSFTRAGSAIGTPYEASVMRTLYAAIRPANFSHQVLANPETNLAVLPVTDVEWSDLGDARRLMDTLARVRNGTAYAVG
jgi:mannose-1-phosphate guanylyltransferase